MYYYGDQAPTTLEELVSKAHDHTTYIRATADSHYRNGQGLWNYTEHWLPEAVKGLAGGPLDPFHSDANIFAFLAHVVDYFSVTRA